MSGHETLEDTQPLRVIGELQTSLQRASELLGTLKDQVPDEPSTEPVVAKGQVEDLIERLETQEIDLSEMSDRLVEAENHRGRLMNLYVATYQLHATLDVDEVKAAIAEIARDLLGAEAFALLLREENQQRCEVALTEGLGEGSLFGRPYYYGGDASVDRTLTDGSMLTRHQEGSSALAVVPLRVQGSVVGALVLVKLFDHKPNLTNGDRDLLDLLAAHAASALFAARVYSRTDRKLKTLESLVKLVRE